MFTCDSLCVLVASGWTSLCQWRAGVNGWSQWSWPIQKPRVKICIDEPQSALHTPVLPTEDPTRSEMSPSAVVNLLLMCCGYWHTGCYSCLLIFVQYLFYEALLLLFLVHWTHTLLPPLTALPVETPQWVKAPPTALTTALSRLRWCVFCVYVWRMFFEKASCDEALLYIR